MAAGIYQLYAGRWQTPGDTQREFRQRSAKLIRDILDEDPMNVDALLGLAGLAETSDERVRRLRQVVAADPTNEGHLEFLSRALSSDESNLLEAAELLEQAYAVQLPRGKGPYTWRFARDAMWEYEWAGFPDRAAELRKRVRQDFGADALLHEAASAETADPERLKSALEGLCLEMSLAVLGPESCLAGIQQVVDAADRAQQPSVAARLAATASDAMFVAASSGTRLSTADPDWRRRFEMTLERHFGPDAAARMHDAQSLVTVE